MEALTKHSSSNEIEKYFTAVLKLSKACEEFPVNLEEVWPLVYSRKEEATRALTSDSQFIENIDYQVLRKNAENPKGGRPSNEYHLTVSCMEFFIARKVRDVFEVYRKVFHKTAEQKEIASEPKQSKPVSPRTLQLMKLDTANWLMKNLNYSDTAKLALAKAIADPLELPVPVYAKSKGVIHSATDRLKERNIQLSTQKFNMIMVQAGMLERASRYSRSKGKNVTWPVLVGDGLKYGENGVHPDNPRETQPSYYDEKFDELLSILGIKNIKK